MDVLVICVSALLVSGLTLFSGFGLGTLLLPAFAIFFPSEIAVAMTAVVHLANNLFKLVLVGRNVDRKVALRFGLPAVAASFLGAWLLVQLAENATPIRYDLFGYEARVTVLNLVLAAMIALFALLELLPAADKLAFSPRLLPLGGLLSGFFGGLSGHQGALRAAFLIKCGLEKRQYIATGVVIACVVDVTRLVLYTAHFSQNGLGDNTLLLVLATLSAFLGAFVGSRLIGKVTLRAVRTLVAILLLVTSAGLATGMI